MRSVVPVLLAAAGAAAYNNGLGTVPPLGWSSWCVQDVTCGLVDTCTEGEIHSVTDAMQKAGMADIGYKYVFLDDCWASTERDASGNIQPDADQFPDGIPALRQFTQAAGFDLGLYTCAGPTTCRWSRIGSGGHYFQDARMFAKWGVSFVKADNCHHPDLPPPVYYGNMSAGLNASGWPMHFNLCEWGDDHVWTWGGSIAQSFRVGPDHLPVWSFPALQTEIALWGLQSRGVPAAEVALHLPDAPAHVIAAEDETKRGQRSEWHRRLLASGSPRGLTGSLERLSSRLAGGLGQGTSDIIEHMADVANYTSGYGKADPDFAETLLWFLTPYVDSQTEWSFWCLWGGNLLFATDPRNMTSDMASIVLNAEAIDVHQDAHARPGSRRAVAPSGVQLWARDMTDGTVAAILYNPTEANQTASMAWADVGVNGMPSKVRDLWQHADLSPSASGFSRELVPHQVAFLRLTK